MRRHEAFLLVFHVALSIVAVGPGASSRVVGAERFPFVIPGFDAAPAATDVSFLSRRPAGARGPVEVKGGHFVDGSGERLRLLGVNFSFGANFPEHTDAEKVAAHLAKLGVNAVRHHHMDARDIWRQRGGGTRELDPGKLDRLAYLIAQLKKNGIYSNINLHVSRSVTVAEGFPDAAKLPRYNKYVLYFDQRLRESLKEYARGLLGFRSPYTGLRLADEPSIVTVEITNENRFSRAGTGPLESLPERYQDQFRRLWNRWLLERYDTTAALRKAWGETREALGSDLASFCDFRRDAAPWSLNTHGAKSRAKLITGQPGPTAELMAGQVEIERVDDVVWHLELAAGNLSVEEGNLYTMSFWVRAEKPRRVYVDVSRHGEPWEAVGIGETIDVGTGWQQVVRTFRAATTLRGTARWIFKIGDSDSDLWLAGMHLRRGGEITPVPRGASLEKGTVPVPRSSRGEVAAEDLRAFMEHTERVFFADLYRFLKKELGVKAPVTGSQARWAALSSFEPLDFVDAHAYWEHPRFPRSSWDRRDWLIPNTAMVRKPGADALTRLAWPRLWGRPYTVSEYNHPAPNDYQVECVPLLAAFAALQDWDGVYLYSYQHGNRSWDAVKIQSFFDINGNPAKLALLPAAAMLFRRADVAPARQELVAGEDENPPPGLSLRHRAGTQLGSKPGPGKAKPSGRRFASDTGEVRWEADDPAKARFLVDTGRTKLALGFIAEDRIELGELTLETGAATRNFGCVSLTSLDGKRLTESRRLLMTTLANAENSGMKWNVERTSVSDEWGGPPPLVEIVPARLTLRPAEAGWKIYALDGRGARRREVEAQGERGGLSFQADPAHRTVWYELVRE